MAHFDCYIWTLNIKHKGCHNCIQNIDIKNVLSHELVPVLTHMFKNNGVMMIVNWNTTLETSTS